MNLLVNYGIKASVVPPAAAGYYELLHDSGTITSGFENYTISGLSIAKGEKVILEGTVFVTGNPVETQMYINGNSTVSNYYNQVIQMESSTLYANRENNTRYSVALTTAPSYFISDINISENGYFICKTNTTAGLGTSSLRIHDRFLNSNFPISSLTSITIESGTASFGTGCRFRLYKVKD